MENPELFEQHPIPQQISSYQFRLVGDMTLKQFFQVAGGALVSIIIYASGIPALFKWPLVIGSFLLGLGLAFFPIQDRPLERWIVAFFKSIYSPTIFRWKSTGKPYVFYQSDKPTALTGSKSGPPLQTEVGVSKQPPTDKQQAEIITAQVQLEKKETDFFSRISNLFGGRSADTSQVQTVALPKAPDATRENQISNQISKYSQFQTPSQDLSQGQNIPISTHTSDFTTSVSSSTAQTQSQPIRQAQYSPESAPPLPPTVPNILVGQVVTEDGKIVDSAILEIRDSEGRPARAVKTNKLGHFSIVTPLINGEFQIITEKEDYEFNPVKITVVGEIIPPIMVKGKKLVHQEAEGTNL